MNRSLAARTVRGSVFAVSFWAPLSADGSEPPLVGVKLEWVAPADCPDEATARNTIQGYLGARSLEAFKPVFVRVEITPTSNGRYRGRLSLRGEASGDRRFEGPTCARVSEAAALIVAIMLDPVEVATQVEASSQKAPTDPTKPSGGMSGATSAPLSRQNGSGKWFSVGVEASLDYGSLPGGTFAAGVVLGMRAHHLLAEAAATAFASSRDFRGPTPQSGGKYELYTGSLRACYLAIRVPAEGSSAGPCVRTEFGVSYAEGFGVAESLTPSAPWGAALFGFTARIRYRPPLTSWVSFEGGFPFLRPTYAIEGFGTVFQPGPLLGRMSLGVAWTFP